VQRLFLLVLLIGSGCGRPRSADEIYKRSEDYRRRGLWKLALNLADEGWQQWKDRPGSDWHWRFRLLQAELSPGQAESLLEGDGGPASSELRARYLADLGQAKRIPALVEQAYEIACQEKLRNLIPTIELKRAYLDGYTRRSEPFLRHALALAAEQADLYTEAAALLDLGYLRIRLSRFDEAIPFDERAEVVARAVSAGRLRERALGDLGWCYYRLGDFDRALRSLSEATTLARQIGDDDRLRRWLNDLGNVYYRIGEFRLAISYYHQAADLARRMDNIPSLIMALNNLAASSLETGDLAAAERFDQQADELLAKFPDAESLLHSELHSARIEAAKKDLAKAEASFRAVIDSAKRQHNPLVLWEAEAGLAEQLHGQGRDTEAGAAYRRALDTIEGEWSNLGEDRHKVTFLAQLIRFYGDYVDLLMAQGQADRAAALADSSRARVLAEELGSEPSSRNIASDPTRNGHVLLSYWLAPRHSYLWVIGPNAVSHYTLPGDEHIAELIKQYRAAIERGHDPLGRDNPAGRLLYEALVEPARAAIPSGASVIVIPDGSLHGLNFETLIVDAPKPHYWIEDVSVAVAPAVGLLEASPRPRRQAGKILFIGDPAEADPIYPPLPHLKVEAAIVERAFPTPSSSVYTGERASPRAYAAADPGNYSLIHFAAHAVANAESPLNSAIILSKADGEYKLYAEDVLRQRLQADLVTISACRSAGAKSYAGEGLVGFTWAFLQAGARNVIAGLWDADDEATAELMGEFYRRLVAGSTPAEALRQAKLKLLRSTARSQRPYYWGSLQLFTREVTARPKS
jgi:CHAT domain-containing protein/Flp pilus assembly protein TadD